MFEQLFQAWTLSTRAITRSLCLTAFASTLSGCSTVGVRSIDYGRTPYNQVIHDTGSEQTLLNIVRVSRHEAPLFMDVSEVDQATSVTGSITGGASGIGSRGNPNTTQGTIAGLVGAISGTASYQESPTVRYFPLSGQALIAQVSTPITPEQIANLKNSNWPLSAVLTLGLDRITPGSADYHSAVNALTELDKYGAILVTATQAPEIEKSAKIAKLTFDVTPPPTKDNLTVFFKPYQIDKEPTACDRPEADQSEKDARPVVNALWRRLQRIYRAGDPNSKLVTDEYITMPSKGSLGSFSARGGKRMTPPQQQVLATRSALGILKSASEQDFTPTIAILTEQEVRYYVELERHRHGACDDHFYTLDPLMQRRTQYENGQKEPDASRDRKIALRKRIYDINISLDDWLPTKEILSDSDREAERLLLDQRRYMLVVRSDRRPSNAFVAVYQDGQWYSILSDDDISKSTLALITQFSTIQAIPNQSPQLTPTISVGAR